MGLVYLYLPMDLADRLILCHPVDLVALVDLYLPMDPADPLVLFLPEVLRFPYHLADLIVQLDLCLQMDLDPLLFLCLLCHPCHLCHW